MENIEKLINTIRELGFEFADDVVITLSNKRKTPNTISFRLYTPEYKLELGKCKTNIKENIQS